MPPKKILVTGDWVADWNLGFSGNDADGSSQQALAAALARLEDDGQIILKHGAVLHGGTLHKILQTLPSPGTILIWFQIQPPKNPAGIRASRMPKDPTSSVASAALST